LTDAAKKAACFRKTGLAIKSLLPVNLKPFSGGANGRAWVNLKEFAFKVRFTGGEGDLGASSRNDSTTYTPPPPGKTRRDIITRRVPPRSTEAHARDSLGTGISTRADE
jgi:hypothetical protein